MDQYTPKQKQDHAQNNQNPKDQVSGSSAGMDKNKTTGKVGNNMVKDEPIAGNRSAGDQNNDGSDSSYQNSTADNRPSMK